MNEQPVEKINHEAQLLDVHSVFDTIQGEGPFSGQRAVFIRLAGCNLQCPLCDTDYTEGRFKIAVDGLIEKIADLKSKSKLIVLTGGEPFRQNISGLTKQLMGKGYEVQIETNGTIFLEGFPYKDVTVVCSPKTPKIHPKLEKFISAYKYVISSGLVDSDYLPVNVLGLGYERPIQKPTDGVPVYVQPCDSKDNTVNMKNLETCIEAVRENEYILNLQIHKFIGVE